DREAPVVAEGRLAAVAVEGLAILVVPLPELLDVVREEAAAEADPQRVALGRPAVVHQLPGEVYRGEDDPEVEILLRQEVGAVPEQEGVAGGVAVAAQRALDAQLEVGAGLRVDLAGRVAGRSEETRHQGGEEGPPTAPPAADRE